MFLRTDIARLSVNKEFNFHSHFEYARSSVLSQRYCFFSSQEWLYEINIRTSRYRWKLRETYRFILYAYHKWLIFNFHSHIEYAWRGFLNRRHCFFLAQEWLYEINIHIAISLIVPGPRKRCTSPRYSRRANHPKVGRIRGHYDNHCLTRSRENPTDNLRKCERLRCPPFVRPSHCMSPLKNLRTNY